jgi:hypothetical protein
MSNAFYESRNNLQTSGVTMVYEETGEKDVTMLLSEKDVTMMVLSPTQSTLAPVTTRDAIVARLSSADQPGPGSLPPRDTRRRRMPAGSA